MSGAHFGQYMLVSSKHAPEQGDGRTVGDLDFCVRYVKAWIVDQLDWAELPASSNDFFEKPPRPALVTVRASGKGIAIDTQSALTASDAKEAVEVLRLVNEQVVAAFETGGTGDYRVMIHLGTPASRQTLTCEVTAEFGLEIRGEAARVVGVADVLRRDASAYVFPITEGFYRVTVGTKDTSPIGDPSVIHIVLEAVVNRFSRVHERLPRLPTDPS